MGTRQQATPDIDTGDVLNVSERPRRAQDLGGGMYANLTHIGAGIHDIEKGTPVTVTVCENGIWISTAND